MAFPFKAVKTDEAATPKVKSPWSFKAPSYDDRNLANAGNKFGIGSRNPVGHEGSPKQHVDALPQERSIHPLKSDG
jgi:hypothetical protein